MKTKTILPILLLSLILIVNAQSKVKSLAIKDSIKSKLKLVDEKDSAVFYKGKFRLYKKNAHASYYGERFNGRKTASGRLFDMNKLTAAHKKFPFGTKLRVTNESNGKSVIIEVTDRGPFVKGRELDLSKRAFFTIANSSGAGYIKTTIEILQK